MPAWTDEEDATLRKLWNEDELSGAEIGYRINKSRNAVIGRAHRLGLPLRGQPRGPAPKKGYGELLIRRRRDAEARKRRMEATKAQPKRKRNARDPVVIPSAARHKGLIKERGPCPPEVKPKGIPLADLKPHQCRWPEGEGPYTFCGHRIEPDGQNPYCAYHQWIGTKPTPKITGIGLK